MVWLIWLLAIIVSFGFLEAYAFNHPTRINTLSRTVANMGANFPLSIAVFGMVVGGLSVHFFWGWCASPLLPGAG